MKKLTLLLFSVFALTAMAQVTTVPAIIQKGYTGEVTIIFNPNEGNKGMASATQCYAHTGVITSASTADNDWKNVVEEWRKNTDKTKMINLLYISYSYRLTGTIISHVRQL